MSLLQFKTYALTAGEWAPIILVGNVTKAWLQFPQNIIICSSTTDVTQQQELSVSGGGGEFMIPLVSVVNYPQPGALLCWATVPTGSGTVTLFSINTEP